MSELNINRNVFLEKEELRRFQKFLQENISHIVFLKNTTAYGLVLSDFVNQTPNDFLIQAGTNVGTVKLVNDSWALDKDGLLIYQKAFDNLAVPNDGKYYWMKISQQYDPSEIGVCSVNTAGQLVGVGTKFSDVLRGQATEVPVKIKFLELDGSAPTNNQIYEVVDVTDDLNVLLAGSFTAESNLKYVVIGSTPVSEAITQAQQSGLYKYDSCKIEFIEESSVNTLPTANYTVDKQFYVARVMNSGGVVTIQDKRAKWWSFNIPGLGDKLVKTNNLSDVSSTATARANLGAVSMQEVEAAHFADSGWQNMIRGAAADASGFTLKIRRVGKNVVITGTFTGASTLADGQVLASIALSTIGADANPAVRIVAESNQVNTSSTPRGASFYIDPVVGGTDLQIKVLSHYGAYSGALNISYIGG
jgi:hypothetical protein